MAGEPRAPRVKKPRADKGEVPAVDPTTPQAADPAAVVMDPAPTPPTPPAPPAPPVEPPVEQAEPFAEPELVTGRNGKVSAKGLGSLGALLEAAPAAEKKPRASKKKRDGEAAPQAIDTELVRKPFSRTEMAAEEAKAAEDTDDGHGSEAESSDEELDPLSALLADLGEAGDAEMRLNEEIDILVRERASKLKELPKVKASKNDKTGWLQRIKQGWESRVTHYQDPVQWTDNDFAEFVKEEIITEKKAKDFKVVRGWIAMDEETMAKMKPEIRALAKKAIEEYKKQITLIQARLQQEVEKQNKRIADVTNRIESFYGGRIGDIESRIGEIEADPAVLPRAQELEEERERRERTDTELRKARAAKAAQELKENILKETKTAHDQLGKLHDQAMGALLDIMGKDDEYAKELMALFLEKDKAKRKEGFEKAKKEFIAKVKEAEQDPMLMGAIIQLVPWMRVGRGQNYGELLKFVKRGDVIAAATQESKKNLVQLANENNLFNELYGTQKGRMFRGKEVTQDNEFWTAYNSARKKLVDETRKSQPTVGKPGERAGASKQVDEAERRKKELELKAEIDRIKWLPQGFQTKDGRGAFQLDLVKAKGSLRLVVLESVGLTGVKKGDTSELNMNGFSDIVKTVAYKLVPGAQELYNTLQQERAKKQEAAEAAEAAAFAESVKVVEELHAKAWETIKQFTGDTVNKGEVVTAVQIPMIVERLAKLDALRKSLVTGVQQEVSLQGAEAWKQVEGLVPWESQGTRYKQRMIDFTDSTKKSRNVERNKKIAELVKEREQLNLLFGEVPEKGKVVPANENFWEAFHEAMKSRPKLKAQSEINAAQGTKPAAGANEAKLATLKALDPSATPSREKGKGMIDLLPELTQLADLAAATRIGKDALGFEVKNSAGKVSGAIRLERGTAKSGSAIWKIAEIVGQTGVKPELTSEINGNTFPRHIRDIARASGKFPEMTVPVAPQAPAAPAKPAEKKK